MFGKTIDYYLLRPFSHSRNIASEEQLDAIYNQGSFIDIDHAIFRVRKLMQRLEGHFPLRGDLCYLDIGCGSGDIAIALNRLGVKNITGIDIVQRQISQAIRRAQQLQVEQNVKFICGDINQWQSPCQYDVILSHEALEHINNPELFLRKVAQLIVPHGILVLAFGPLFHSPCGGDHMSDFFRIEIPWRGVIFSEKAILRLRQENFRPTDPVCHYHEVKGGLNLMRYSEFLKYVFKTKWEFDFLIVNPQLKRFKPLFYLSNAFVRLPVVQDYFASSVYAILRRTM
jgi:2-polyprenyl-3-methyl-5-hydroxy-6-metoxy-1,4-benzoquinol methylase